MKVDKTKWGKKTLGEICYIYDSQRKPVSKENRIKGIYPYYGATGLQDYVHDYIFDGRYLLLGEDGGKWNAKENSAYIVEGKIWVNNHAHILQFKNNIIDSYICYYLNYSDLMEYITGSIVPKLTQAKMRKIEIPIPPLTEQRAIVAELDAVQKMIEGYKAQLADLDTLAQSIFLDMFGDVVNNERKWNFVKFGSLTSSINYGTSAPAVDGGKYKYLRMGNITDNGHLDFQDIKYIDIPDNEIAKYIVHKGDILFNRTNSREKVGKTACFMEEEEMIIAGYIIRIRLNEEKSLPLYIAQAFNTPEMKSYLRRLARGSVGQANINSKELSDIKIPVPPLPLQQQFAERVEAIERQKELLQAQLAEAQTLMAERMQYYFD